MKQKNFTAIATMTVILSAFACIFENVTVMTAELNPDISGRFATMQAS